MQSNRYKLLSDGAKASVWFMICNIVQKGVSFFAVPIFVRLMTESEYGIYFTFLSWENILSIFATLNLSHQSFNNGMVRFEGDTDGYTTSMVGLTITIGIITSLVYKLVSGRMGQYFGFDSRYMPWMFVNMMASGINGLWIVGERYKFRFRALSAYTICVAVMNPVLGLSLIRCAEDRALARIISVVVVDLLACLVVLCVLLKRSKKLFSWKYWKYALKLNIPLIPHYLSMVLLSNSDRIMISRYYGAESVAKYSLANNIATVMYFVTNAINASFIPWIYHKMKGKEYRTIYNLSGIISFVIASVTLIPAFFARELMAVMGTPEYAEATSLIPAMTSCVLMTFGYTLFSNVELYFEKTKFIAVGTFGTALLNIILNAVFIPMIGYEAAAYTTLFCYSALFVFHYLAMRRVCAEKRVKSPIYNTKLLTRICVATVTAALILGRLQELLLIRLMLFTAMCLIGVVFRKRIISVMHKVREQNG